MNNKQTQTLAYFKKRLRMKNYSQNTIIVYVNYVSTFLKEIDKPLSHITIKDCRDYVENFKFTSTPQQNQVYSSLKAFYLLQLEIDLSNKIFLERPRKEFRLPTIIEKDFLLDKISRISNIKHKAIISIAASVGLRVSEVINLKIKDIDFDRKVISIKQGKGKKDRIVPLSENISRLVYEYISKYNPNTFLFNGQFSLKYSSSSCNNIVKKYIGKEYHFHLLRHFAFTNLVDNGTDISIIQKLAGHSSIKTTSIYLHLSTSKLNNLPLAL